ncbi:hypothetical protein LEN26_011705 [Aphanomyces euteiches]|nr:hypothetical protein LEN26_011705 [Aphanomyces euteiches]KAH9124365.1 hypothetical protein AeMF1_004866 [Aphanomyces euteiches]KAH9190002.1 hypothetical protein AeNC1_008018 [Aphanomyces euteiches]
MKPWLHLYGLARLPRLLTTIQFGNYLALAYGVHTGDMQLMNAMANMSNKNVVEMEHLVWIAIASNQIDMLEALQRCGYTPEKLKEFLVYGIGDAVARGHMEMAEHLTIQVEDINSVDWLCYASRESLQANLRTMFKTRRLDNLP